MVNANHPIVQKFIQKNIHKWECEEILYELLDRMKITFRINKMLFSETEIKLDIRVQATVHDEDLRKKMDTEDQYLKVYTKLIRNLYVFQDVADTYCKYVNDGRLMKVSVANLEIISIHDPL